ncbi:hypothetical protein [Rhizobium sp. MHM7A]|uniref:hypothetical protein n=1 Tax=Rhizobium sp. MHM7A TaxID=2583233 RepID=UPI0011072919|nr:hypothetical protein [Rhizobium sp. MHM7A]TLX16190.1 hypothetical protein FFR93_02360 [Rhizobium sp. MHM7A]
MSISISGGQSVTDVERFVALMRRTPFVMKDEKSVQAAIAVVLDSHGIDYKREVKLSESDIVDFMLPGGVAVEVKLKAQKREIYRQCKRYCEHEQVKIIVLMTATIMGFPPEIEGKPAYYVSMGRSWL